MNLAVLAQIVQFPGNDRRRSSRARTPARRAFWQWFTIHIADFPVAFRLPERRPRFLVLFSPLALAWSRLGAFAAFRQYRKNPGARSELGAPAPVVPAGGE